MTWLAANWQLAISLVATLVSTVGLGLTVRYHCNNDKKSRDVDYLERGRQIERSEDHERRIAILEARER